MKPVLVTCPSCGHQFDPHGLAACPACPLNKGCKMVCCPRCGSTTVDVKQSSLARLASKLFKVESIEP